MKRLLIVVAINLGLNGIIIGAAPVVPVVTSSPGNTQSQAIPIPTQISNQEAKDATAILDIATKGVGDLTSHTQKIEQTMNSMQAQALSDANLGKDDTFQGYITRLVNTVTDGQSSLESLADSYKNQIDASNKTAATALDTLAGTDSTNKTAADASKNMLNSQALNSRGQIDTARDTNITALTTLRTTIQTTIESTHNTLSKSSSGGSDVVDKILSFLDNPGVKELGSIVLIYLAKKFICSISSFGFCKIKTAGDLKVEEMLKRLGLPTELDALLKKVGLNRLSELMAKSPALAESVKAQLAEKLGIAQNRINDVIAKVGKKVGASDDNITDFIEKVSDIQTKLAQALPGLAEEHLLPKIGDALSKATGRDIDVNNIVQQIRTAVAEPSGPPVINTGSNTNNSLEMAAQKARSAVLNEIKQNRLTRQEFIEQINELKASSAQLQGAAKTMADEKIAAGEKVIEETAGESGTPDAEDPFMPEL